MKLSFRVHPAGYWMLAAALFFGHAELVLAALLALAWHEGAHLLAMALSGVKRCRIELTPFGGVADAADFERLSPGKQAFIALAGVCMSALGGFVCMRLLPREPFWIAFGNTHFSLALLNALPVWPLDGARALYAAAACFGVQTAFRRVMRWLAYAFAALLLALGLYGVWHGHMNASLFLLAPYLCYAARESTLGLGVRHMQRAQDAQGKLSVRVPVLPIRAIAAAKEPSALELTRLMSQMPCEKYHLLCIINTESGKIENVLTEHDLARKLFSHT
ncbi:MAG: hypothetical protein RR065_09255 [Clostridia bacterium]